LFVPPLIMLIVSFVITLQTAPARPSGMPTLTPQLLTVGFMTLFLMLAVSFLVILGQASMTGKVMAENRAKLSDWVEGIRKYFFRVLGLGLIFLAVAFVLLMVVGVIYAFTILPEMITVEGTIKPPTIASLPHSTYAMTMATTLIMTLVQGAFYVWLAPAVMENKSVGASLDSGLNTLKRRWRPFLFFIIIFFIIALTAQSIKIIPELYVVYIKPIVGGLEPTGRVLTVTSLISQVIEKAFSPLWFLIAFNLYRANESG